MEGRRAIVLMYHQIDPEGVSSGWVPNDLADSRYGVPLSDFREQMALLRERKIPVAGLAEFLSGEGKNSPDAPVSVIVTFDDGYASDFDRAAPVMEELGIPATFFLATGHLGKDGMLTESRARDLGAFPLFSLGSHGVTHRFLSHLPFEECEREVLDSFERLDGLSPKRTFSLSAPGGRTSDRVATAVRRTGFRSLCTSRPGFFRQGGDPYSIPRLPVMRGWSAEDFLMLLDPDSSAFQRNRWIRSSKNLVRALLEFPRTGTGRGVL
ncbi:MAG: polysaccharide deacetylase family protein [Nitrospirota bacterium]|nr:polysaccharide deacetylase family protein [Nitrospirota bacterium]